jgi:hypothetical protein
MKGMHNAFLSFVEGSGEKSNFLDDLQAVANAKGLIVTDNRLY